MKLSLAILATTLAISAEAGSSEKWENLRRKLSYEMVAGYKPESQVTDHCAIDLDQAAIEEQLAAGTEGGFQNARKIYNNGGNSKSYASITISPGLTKAIVKGDTIMGRSESDVEIAGKVGQTHNSGETALKIYYKTTDIQDNYVNCQVGGLPEPNLEGCFKEVGDLTIGGDTYTYTYNPETENKADRTIAGFSTGAEKKMLKNSNDCPGCPYKHFKYFYDYYGTSTYAHEWVEAAFDKRQTSFSRGGANFALYGNAGLEQIIKKGTAYLNIFMYVMREFEDAMDDCKKGLLQDNYNSVHAWDEGVCFYTGSIEGQVGLTDSGKLLHQLADKRCENYKTCGPDGVDTDGQAKANYDLMDKFALGNEQILSGNCSAAKVTTAQIMELLYIPMIQGTMRYAYKVGAQGGEEKEKAEGAAFAAAVLPRVHAASPAAATTIYNSMKVGAGSTDFRAVKSAFESVYADMGISCADIGGLWNEAEKAYYSGMEPCGAGVSSQSSGSSSTSIVTSVAVVLSAMVAASL